MTDLSEHTIQMNPSRPAQSEPSGEYLKYLIHALSTCVWKTSCEHETLWSSTTKSR